MLTHRSALRRRTQNPQETTCSAAPRNPTDAVTPRRKGRSGGALGCGDAAPEAAEGIDLCHANVARLGQNAPLQACRSLATSPAPRLDRGAPGISQMRSKGSAKAARFAEYGRHRTFHDTKPKSRLKRFIFATVC